MAKFIRIASVLLGMVFFVFVTSMLTLGSYYIIKILTYDGLYSGIYVDDYNISGTASGNFQSTIDSINYDLSKKQITLGVGSKDKVYSFAEFGYSYDTSNAIDTAYNYGHEGTILKRLFQIYYLHKNNITIPLNIVSNENIIRIKIDELYNDIYKQKEQHKYTLNESNLLLQTGQKGISFDKEEIVQKLLSLNLKNDIFIEIPLFLDTPDFLAINNIIESIIIEKSEARLIINENTFEITDHVIGRDIEYEVLENALNKIHQSFDLTISIPFDYHSPTISKEYLEEMLFRDILASKATYFGISTENGRNRGINITLSSSEIFGTVLEPDEIFSFNETVGKRTSLKGYAIAHAYIGGEIVDVVGGGICQVSSTLYNAVLLSGLEVIERNQHYFTVDYVPYGQDATVSFGTKDFKFKNSFDWPILISGNVNENSIYFEILGTNKNPDREIIIENNITEVIKFQKYEIYTDMLPFDVVEKGLNGKNGYKVDTYEVVFENSEQISKKLLYKSYYRPYNETTKVGTFKSSNELTTLEYYITTY